MEWYDNYSIGVEHIDEQHKMLVRAISKLQDSLHDGKFNPTVGASLKFIVEYTQKHFSEEEEFMGSIGFDQLESHSEQHKKLVEDVMRILLDLKKGKTIDAYELIDFLTDWLMNHILQEDKKIGKFLERKQNSQQV